MISKENKKYLEKYSNGIEGEIIVSPSPDLSLVVVVPCYKEQDAADAIDALFDCELPIGVVEVIAVVNHPIDASEEVKKISDQTSTELEKLAINRNCLKRQLHVVKAYDVPAKKAGVGNARKIGMDEALRRFSQLNKTGIIANYDADCTCEVNYLKEIENHFLIHPQTPGCSIYFEHPLNGNYSDEIAEYELFLRYYKLAHEYVGVPFAFHTVGSSMAVRSDAYRKQGGMNRRKAGEDFYFIHKIIALKNYTELNTTSVFPNDRLSDRVPFGTGRAMMEWQKENRSYYPAYPLEVFEIIKQITENHQLLFELDFRQLKEKLNPLLITFFEQLNWEEELVKIKQQVASEENFIHRFYFYYFNAFQLMKLVHFISDNGFPKKATLMESRRLLEKLISEKTTFETVKEALNYYRKLEKSKSV